MTIKDAPNAKIFNKVLIVGLGLIGGSFCLGIRKAGLAKKIIGYDTNSQTLKEAANTKIVHQVSADLTEAIDQITGTEDLIVIAVPLFATEEVLTACQQVEATIMDVGSAKSHLKPLLINLWGKVPSHFVSVHPIAGSEQNGLAAAKADLFDHHKLVIVPFRQTDPAKVAQVAKLWQALGSDVFYMDWQTHDTIFSYTSHLPHLLAYNLVECLGNHPLQPDLFRFAASGFRDFTRIAASDEKMWGDIFAVNKDKLILALSHFQKFLADMRKDIQIDKREKLLERLKQNRNYRKAYENNQEIEQENYICSPCSALKGEVTVAADKSISHRAVMFGALAKGVTQVYNFLPAADTLATLECFRAMKIAIKQDGSSLTIKGNGLDGLERPYYFLDCGNAGTAARLMTGLLSGQEFISQLQGDTSLSKRPMRRVIHPLEQMGAQIYAHNQENLPLLIFGNPDLHSIEYHVPVPSAQVKSAILLAALYAEGETTIIEQAPTRDHTERMLKNFGYSIKTSANQLVIKGRGTLHSAEIKVPADISSAAFFMVAATIVPDSHILLKNIGINARRIGIINILKQMGANIQLHNQKQFGNELVADIEVSYAPLNGIDIPPEQVPLAIDELPVVMIAAACAHGITKLTNAAELRVKESDRIGAMVAGLKQLGIKAKATEDGAIIEGGSIRGGIVDSYDDHRIAMSFAVAACRAQKEVQIKRCANVATSFPNFINCAQEVGMTVRSFYG